MKRETEVLGAQGPGSRDMHSDVVDTHQQTASASLLLLRARLAGSYGDESGESTHPIKHKQISGHISVDDCAQLRQIQWQDAVSSNPSIPPTSSPSNPLEE
jgi:hypothetical protein